MIIAPTAATACLISSVFVALGIAKPILRLKRLKKNHKNKGFFLKFYLSIVQLDPERLQNNCSQN